MNRRKLTEFSGKIFPRQHIVLFVPGGGKKKEEIAALLLYIGPFDELVWSSQFFAFSRWYQYTRNAVCTTRLNSNKRNEKKVRGSVPFFRFFENFKWETGWWMYRNIKAFCPFWWNRFRHNQIVWRGGWNWQFPFLLSPPPVVQPGLKRKVRAVKRAKTHWFLCVS